MEPSFSTKFQGRLQSLIKILQVGIKLFIVICAILWLWERIDDRLSLQDKSAIDNLYLQFEGYIREGNFASAYDMMLPAYQARNTLERFAQRFDFLYTSNEKFRLHPQRYLNIRKDTAVLLPQSILPPPPWLGTALKLKKVDGKWYFTGETVGFVD